MNNMKRWENTLEKLHDIEPAPFNPDYNEEYAKMAELQAKFMYKIRKELSKIETNDNEEILNKIEDLCYVYSSAINNMYSYSIENGKIKHTTERGQKLADIFNN